MMTKRWTWVFAIGLFAAIACGKTETQQPPPGDDAGVDAGTDAGTDAGVDGGTDAGTDGGTDAGTDAGTDGGVTAECDKQANLDKAAQLAAAQPAFVAGTNPRSKSIITAPVSFASVAGVPSVQCSVNLKFKDLNGSGTLEPYENWTSSADARAADLVSRMTVDEKLGLMAHATIDDVLTANSDVSASLTGSVAAGIRFGATHANTASLIRRATWANNLQALSEASRLGIPFVISSEPSHNIGNGRAIGSGFWQLPYELGLAASGNLAVVQRAAQVVSEEYRSIGITMALSVPADLATEPRWFGNQFTFGDSATSVSAAVGAYVKGLQGDAIGPSSVAAVVGHFPGAGPAYDGWDGRLLKGYYLTYPGGSADPHFAAFQGAFDNHAAGVMPAYGVPQTGAWTALSDLIDGTTVEQVAPTFNKELITDALRTHFAFSGLVLAPWGAIDDTAATPPGAPWGVESSSKAQRIAKAVAAGVDQFGGLNDTVALAAARTAGPIADAAIDAAAKHALVLMFQLGLFENPYVDPAQAPAVCIRHDVDSFNVQDASMVLLVNAVKPEGWLNGGGDGSQTGDPYNAGNGSGRVLPAPKGIPYGSFPAARFYIGASNIDLDYVQTVKDGYGVLSNNDPEGTEADKMASSDYIFIRISAPCTVDPDSAPWGHCKQSLEYTSEENLAANAALLQPIIDARAAIDSHAGSKAQIIVGVDGGRPAVLSEILSYGVSGLYLEWGVTDKTFLDVAFGIVNGTGKLPVGVPLSDTAVAAQKEDVAGDGQHATFVKGFGYQTQAF